MTNSRLAVSDILAAVDIVDVLAVLAVAVVAVANEVGCAEVQSPRPRDWYLEVHHRSGSDSIYLDRP